MGVGDQGAEEDAPHLARNVPDGRDGRRGVRRGGARAARRRRGAQLPAPGRVAPRAGVHVRGRHPRRGRGGRRVAAAATGAAAAAAARRSSPAAGPWRRSWTRHCSRGGRGSAAADRWEQRRRLGAAGRRQRRGEPLLPGRGGAVRDAAVPAQHGRGDDDEPPEVRPQLVGRLAGPPVVVRCRGQPLELP